jgi:hypothetical protein
MTKSKAGAKGEGRAFGSTDDVVLALEAGELETLSPIRLRYTGPLQDLTAARDDQDVLHTDVQHVENKIINTTVGRVLFNSGLPAGMPFVNGLLKKKGLQQLVQRCYLHHGLQMTVEMLDGLKTTGFTYATRSGLSVGIKDLIIGGRRAACSGGLRRTRDRCRGRWMAPRRIGRAGRARAAGAGGISFRSPGCPGVENDVIVAPGIGGAARFGGGRTGDRRRAGCGPAGPGGDADVADVAFVAVVPATSRMAAGANGRAAR